MGERQESLGGASKRFLRGKRGEKKRREKVRREIEGYDVLDRQSDAIINSDTGGGIRGKSGGTATSASS